MFENIKFVVADIDNTLLVSGYDMSQRTKDAIEDLHKKGILFGIASGRPVKDIKFSINKWNLSFEPDCIIGFNGCELYDGVNNKTYMYNLMKKEWIKEILDLLKGNFNGKPSIYVENYILGDWSDAHLVISADKTGRDAKMFNDESELYQADNAKLMYRVKPEEMAGLEEFLAKHPSDNWSAFKTQPVLMEFAHKAISKGVAVEKFCQFNNISTADCMAFGDMSNDNGMMEVAYGVCLLNGADDTKALAKDITELDCAHDGFADYVEKHLLNK